MNKKDLDNEFDELVNNKKARNLKFIKRREEDMAKRVQLVDEVLKQDIETMIQWFNEKDSKYRFKCNIDHRSSISTLSIEDTKFIKKWISFEKPKLIELHIYYSSYYPSSGKLTCKIWHNFSEYGYSDFLSRNEIAEEDILTDLKGIFFQILEKGTSTYPSY